MFIGKYKDNIEYLQLFSNKIRLLYTFLFLFKKIYKKTYWEVKYILEIDKKFNIKSIFFQMSL